MSIRLAFLLGLLATAATSVASICDNSANDPARCNNPDCVTGPSGAECCIGDCYEGQGPGYLCKMRSSQTCYTQWDIKLKLFDWCDCPPAPPTTTIVARTTAAPVVNIGWWEISTQATTRAPLGEVYDRDLNQMAADRAESADSDSDIEGSPRIIYVTRQQNATEAPSVTASEAPTSEPAQYETSHSNEGTTKSWFGLWYHYFAIGMGGMLFLGIMYCCLFSESVEKYWTPICFGELETVHIDTSSSAINNDITIKLASHFKTGPHAGAYAAFDDYGVPHQYIDGMPLTPMQVQALYREMGEQRDLLLAQKHGALIQESVRVQKSTLAENRVRASLAWPPDQHFMRGKNAGKYAQFDEKGIPAMHADGTPISKFDHKIMLREMAAHQKTWDKHGGAKQAGKPVTGDSTHITLNANGADGMPKLGFYVVGPNAGQYGGYDTDGIPTFYADGQRINIAERKKLRKGMEKEKKRLKKEAQKLGKGIRIVPLPEIGGGGGGGGGNGGETGVSPERSFQTNKYQGRKDRKDSRIAPVGAAQTQDAKQTQEGKKSTRITKQWS